MKFKFACVQSLRIVVFLFPALATFALESPPTLKTPVTNTYFGTAVVDDYQWLENFDDPAVKAWNAKENQVSRAYLDKLPARESLAARLKKLYSATSASYFAFQPRPGILFAMKFKPPAQQPWLITLKSIDDPASERVVFDPNQKNARGTTAIDFVVPSHDCKKVAISLSENGSEDGTLFIYDVASGTALPDQIPHVTVPTGGGSVAWNADDTGIYYTRYPRAGERPEADLHFYQQVYFHHLGSDMGEDHYEIGKDFPRIAEIELDSGRDGRYLLATVANGDGGDFAHDLLGPDKHWVQITRFSDQVKHGEFGRDGALYLISLEKCAFTEKILRLPLEYSRTVQAPKSWCPEKAAPGHPGGSFRRSTVCSCRISSADPSQMVAISAVTTPEGKIVPIKPISAVQEHVLLPDGDDQLFFRNITYIGKTPYAWMAADPARQRNVAPRRWRELRRLDFSDMEVVREFATSKDGTKVPHEHHPTQRNKTGTARNPTLLVRLRRLRHQPLPEFFRFATAESGFDQGRHIRRGKPARRRRVRRGMAQGRKSGHANRMSSMISQPAPTISSRHYGDTRSATN